MVEMMLLLTWPLWLVLLIMLVVMAIADVFESIVAWVRGVLDEL